MANIKYICIKVKSETKPPIPAIVKLEEHFKTFTKYGSTKYGLNQKVSHYTMKSLIGIKVLFYIRQAGNRNFVLVSDLISYKMDIDKRIKTPGPVPSRFKNDKHKLWLHINNLTWSNGNATYNYRSYKSLNDELIPEIRSGFSRIKRK